MPFWPGFVLDKVTETLEELVVRQCRTWRSLSFINVPNPEKKNSLNSLKEAVETLGKALLLVGFIAFLAKYFVNSETFTKIKGVIYSRKIN